MRSLIQSPRDTDFVQDPYPFYQSARACGPLFRWEDYGYVCSASYPVVNTLLRDRRFGRELPEDLKPERPAHLKDFYAIDDLSMLDREPPAHTRLRRLVLHGFTSRQVDRLEPEICAICHELIDRMDNTNIELLNEFAEKLPVEVIARLLGVPSESCDKLLKWSHAMVAVYQARRDRSVEDRANAAARDFATYLRTLVNERRNSPGDDLITELIKAESDGDRLSSDELIATCVLLLNAGHEATVHVIGNGLNTMLGTNFDPTELLSSEKGTIALVEEILRFDPPLHLFTRTALCDLEFEGHEFSRGDTVGCLLAAANRDPTQFTEPDRFDPTRANAATHLSFGAGIHFCVGAPLARKELTVALPILFQRLPDLRLTSRPSYADRYHFHGLCELNVANGQKSDALSRANTDQI